MARKPRLRVSDHAIVRYLERVGGFDIDRLRAQITARLQAAADAGAATIRVEDHVFILGDDPFGDDPFGPVVVTVIDKPTDAEGHQRRLWDGGARR